MPRADGSGKIGAHSAFLSEWQDHDSDGDLLYHDEAGFTGSFGFLGSKTGWGMCRFQTAEPTFLDRVEFWVADATTDVDVYIYGDFNGTVPQNLMASSLDHSFDAAGYHSIQLEEALPWKERRPLVWG